MSVNDITMQAVGQSASAASSVTANGPTNAELVARLERIPITRKLLLIRVIVGISTFFDAYTVLAIAFAMPQLVSAWGLSAAEVGIIISASYVGQLLGAVFFGSLAEKIGRLGVLKITILLFVAMDAACLFAWSAMSMMVIRFLQGFGIGAEVPVASAYINEFVGAKERGRFFLLYEVIFPIGMMFAGMIGYFLVPVVGWKAMFIVGLIPSILTIPLRWMMPESPRWLASKGRTKEADVVVSKLEEEAVQRFGKLPEPVIKPEVPKAATQTNWKELFSEFYRPRTFTIWALWVCGYMINNGLITWLPTLYRKVFELPLETSLAYGWITSAVGVIASIICALFIDRVGRKRWYVFAFFLACGDTVGNFDVAWSNICYPSADLCYCGLCDSSDNYILSVPLFFRVISDTVAGGWHRTGECLVKSGIINWPSYGWGCHGEFRYQICIRCICNSRSCRWYGDMVVCN